MTWIPDKSVIQIVTVDATMQGLTKNKQDKKLTTVGVYHTAKNG